MKQNKKTKSIIGIIIIILVLVLSIYQLKDINKINVKPKLLKEIEFTSSKIVEVDAKSILSLFFHLHYLPQSSDNLL